MPTARSGGDVVTRRCARARGCRRAFEEHAGAAAALDIFPLGIQQEESEP